jgi:hypothetical protein
LISACHFWHIASSKKCSIYSPNTSKQKQTGSACPSSSGMAGHSPANDHPQIPYQKHTSTNNPEPKSILLVGARASRSDYDGHNGNKKGSNLAEDEAIKIAMALGGSIAGYHSGHSAETIPIQ